MRLCLALPGVAGAVHGDGVVVGQLEGAAPGPLISMLMLMLMLMLAPRA